MKKTLWVGLVNNQIGFFATDPVGNVDGLQGSRKFHVENSNIVDDQGNNLIGNTETGGGANSSDITEQQPNQQQTTA